MLGDVSFSDDYGAPRAGTGWHHGNDLFAERGTPVLAVADGTLSRVGVNTLGGNRLWLTDEAGNEFYYAHLSAYAPATVSGAHVTAGQVIAFVGNTGQAITTPPHLHFEVHPSGGDSVDPYPYLVAWQRGSEIPLAFRQAATSPSPAPAVGAVLVDGTPELDEPAGARLRPGRPGQLAGVSRGRRPRSRRGPRRCARPAAARPRRQRRRAREAHRRAGDQLRAEGGVVHLHQQADRPRVGVVEQGGGRSLTRPCGRPAAESRSRQASVVSSARRAPISSASSSEWRARAGSSAKRSSAASSSSPRAANSRRCMLGA